jgi:hypothetical protein
MGQRSPKKAPAPSVRHPKAYKTIAADLVARMKAMEPAQLKELLQQVDLENRRAPLDNSAQPYVQALQRIEEAEPGRAAAILADAGNPESLMVAVKDPTLADLMAPDAGKLIDTINEQRLASMSPSQQAAFGQIVDLLGAYDRAEAEALARYSQLTPEQQARAIATTGDAAVTFSTSAQARSIRDQIENLVMLNDLLDVTEYDPSAPLSQMLAHLAPTLGDMPADDLNKPNRWMTRGDHPPENKLSTYMGDRAKDFRIKDEPTGSRATQLGRMAGPQMREILELAGYSPEDVYGRQGGSLGPGDRGRPRMPTDRVLGILDEFRDPDSQGTRVRGPDGQVRDIGLEGGSRKASRGEQVAGLEQQIDSMQGLADADSQNIVAQLQAQQQKLMNRPMRAPGDSPRAVRELDKRIAAMAGLPIDPEYDLGKHVIDNSNTLIDPDDKLSGYREGGPEAFRDETSRSNAIAFLKRQQEEMRARLAARRPPGQIDREPVGRMTREGGNPNDMRSPQQIEFEKWLEAAQTRMGLEEGLAADPVTGQRYLDEAGPGRLSPDQIGETPDLPAFLYAVPPEVDAAGNITHPNKPMDPTTASNTLAWTLEAETPDWAQAIKPALERAINEQWNVPPETAGRRGGRVFGVNPQTGMLEREMMVPGPEGYRFLTQQAGGDVTGGRLNLEQPSPQRAAPSLDDLGSMPVDDTPPTPASPASFQSMEDWLRQQMDVAPEGDMMTPPPNTPPPGLEDINRMLQDLPLDPDDTGFLGSGAMNNMRNQPLLASLLA